jgi:hypothetical protein
MAKRKRKQRWYCYVCGKPIEQRFILASPAAKTDRVFLVHPDCEEQVDDEYAIKMAVQQAEGEK